MLLAHGDHVVASAVAFPVVPDVVALVVCKVLSDVVALVVCKVLSDVELPVEPPVVPEVEDTVDSHVEVLVAFDVGTAVASDLGQSPSSPTTWKVLDLA